jgi:hypothetical protein
VIPFIVRRIKVANVNRQYQNRKTRLKRRRQEVARFVDNCAAINLAAQKRGEPPTDFTRAIKEFKQFRK